MGELPENDPIRRQPDICLAKNLLNWEPSIKLDKGLEKTINYFINTIKNMEINLKTVITEKYKQKSIPKLAKMLS